MARQARIKSSTGIYHVILRGVNKQKIFLTEADNLKFLQCLEQVKEISKFVIMGFCLMENHIHLLIKENPDGEEIGQIMKRVLNRFVFWYNFNYDRCGPLFQGRYKSEPIEDEQYFIAALRYIHQNPVKAGICRRMADYKWSSYGDYADGHGVLEGLIQTEDILESYSRKELLAFFEESGRASFEITGKRKTDETLYYSISGCHTPKEFSDLSQKQQIAIVSKCIEKGIPLRALERLTGMGYTKVRKIKRGLSPNGLK